MHRERSLESSFNSVELQEIHRFMARKTFRNPKQLTLCNYMNRRVILFLECAEEVKEFNSKIYRNTFNERLHSVFNIQAPSKRYTCCLMLFQSSERTYLSPLEIPKLIISLCRRLLPTNLLLLFKKNKSH